MTKQKAKEEESANCFYISKLTHRDSEFLPSHSDTMQHWNCMLCSNLTPIDHPCICKGIPLSVKLRFCGRFNKMTKNINLI